MPAPIVIAKLPLINKFVYFGALAVLVIAAAIHAYQKFISDPTNEFWEATSWWIGILAAVVVVVTWVIRKGTGV